MDQATHNKIVSFIWGIADDVLRDLFKRGKYPDVAFAEVVGLIEAARQRAFQSVNMELVGLYWQVSEYISRQLESAAWGDGLVAELARCIQRRQPNLRGFTRASLFRMQQFHETYRGNKKVAALLRQLPWTHHLMILRRCKLAEERDSIFRLAAREKWSSRQLERQLKASLFERTVLSPPKVAAVLRQMHPGAIEAFRDSYVVEFLQLPEGTPRPISIAALSPD